MKKKISNRRKFTRLKIDRSVSIPIHIFPSMPFIGKPVEAVLNNISAGGMSLKIQLSSKISTLIKNREIKIHFRLPGKPIQECWGKVVHLIQSDGDNHLLGIKFVKLPKTIEDELNQMSFDNRLCDERIQHEENPWCLPTCSYLALCRKPIRSSSHVELTADHFEITLQTKG